MLYSASAHKMIRERGQTEVLEGHDINVLSRATRIIGEMVRQDLIIPLLSATSVFRFRCGGEVMRCVNDKDFKPWLQYKSKVGL